MNTKSISSIDLTSASVLSPQEAAKIKGGDNSPWINVVPGWNMGDSSGGVYYDTVLNKWRRVR